MTVVQNPGKESVKGEEVENTGNWERFAKRFYLYSGQQKRRNEPQDSIWFYVAISVLYFFLIGVVLIILLLAPKYKSVPQAPVLHHPHSLDVSSAPSVQEIGLSPDLPLADEESDYLTITDSKQSFQTVPKDPLYDIDPRSPIFRGDLYNGQYRHEGRRTRINNKFLED